MSDLILGIDVSDAIARLAIVAGRGGARAEQQGRSEQVISQGIVAAVRADAIKDAARKAIAAAKGKVSAVGVALPSASDAIPEDVVKALISVTKVKPVAIAAGNAAAIAEHWSGAARGARHVISFSIAEHVTAGVLIDGKPFTGAHGFASSVGWLALNPVEREDYRRLGGLEAEVASAGIVRRFVWRIKSGDESRVADQVKGDFSKIAAADIMQGARSGDGVSISVMRDTGKYIGMAVANLASMFDPEIVVLGGIIASSGDVMLEAVRSETSRRLMPQQADRLRIELSALGDDAVAIGAARALA